MYSTSSSTKRNKRLQRSAPLLTPPSPSTPFSLQIDHMMDVGGENEHERTAMRVALDSEDGKRMEDLVSGKIRQLKVLLGLSQIYLRKRYLA